MRQREQKMSEKIRILERSNDFFAVDYKPFEEDLKANEINYSNPPFFQVSLKCCGYGYFDEYKNRMLKNFISYLKDSLGYCKQLTILKIVFHGFHVNDRLIEKICQPIFRAIDTRTLKTIWIHTSNLRGCQNKDIVQMFNIIDRFGILDNSEEISIQMSDWQFINGYPAYQEIFKIFMDFDSNISDTMALNFRKFRLEISSWYMKQKQAYSFLKDSLNLDVIKNHFLSSKPDERSGNSHNRLSSASIMREEDRQSITHTLTKYLDYIDQYYTFPQPPKKPQKDENLQAYRRSRQQYTRMKKEYNENKLQIQSKVKQTQTIISSKLIKFPTEYISQIRMDQFHKQMMTAIVGLIYCMPKIQDFQIDMRNWHHLFGLSSLKKKLDTNVSSRQEFSMLRKGLGILSKHFVRKDKYNQEESQEENQEKVVPLKTAYMM